MDRMSKEVSVSSGSCLIRPIAPTSISAENYAICIDGVGLLVMENAIATIIMATSQSDQKSVL